METLIDFLNALTPFLVILVPLVFKLWDKISKKWKEEAEKQKLKDTMQNIDLYRVWKHEESMKTSSKVNNCCDIHGDLAKTNTSFIQIENGTIAASGISNMYFSCCAEDTKYTTINKLIHTLQRVQYAKVSYWFDEISENYEKFENHEIEDKFTYFTEEELQNTIFYNNYKIKSMISGIVKNHKNNAIIGICNFAFSDPLTKEELKQYKDRMLEFVSAVENIYDNFNISREDYANKLKIPEEERNK